MYKVFSNAKLILPGLEVPPEMGKAGLRLDGTPDPDTIRAAINDFRKATPMQWLQFGMEQGPEAAWQTLKQAMEIEYAAGGFVIGGKENLLLIRRHDIWDLPKGKPFEGEQLTETAIREVKEETGIPEVNIHSFLGYSHHIFERSNTLYLKENHWYLMETDDLCRLEPQTEEGITQAVWVNRETFNNLKAGFYPSLLEIAERGWGIMFSSF